MLPQVVCRFLLRKNDANEMVKMKPIIMERMGNPGMSGGGEVQVESCNVT